MKYDLPEVGEVRHENRYVYCMGGKGAWQDGTNIDGVILTYSRYLAELLAIKEFLAEETRQAEETRVDEIAKVIYEARYPDMSWNGNLYADRWRDAARAAIAETA